MDYEDVVRYLVSNGGKVLRTLEGEMVWDFGRPNKGTRKKVEDALKLLKSRGVECRSDGKQTLYLKVAKRG